MIRSITLQLLSVLCVAISLQNHLMGADTSDQKTQLEVSLKEKSPEVEAALKSLSESLASMHPTDDQNSKVIISEAGRYILSGDLFGDGHSYAIVELDGNIGLGFAEWKSKHWEARGLWRLGVIWRPKIWKEGGDEYFPHRPSERAFWIESTPGEKPAWVVAACEIEKYYQEHYLFRYLPKEHRILLVTEAMDSPKFIGEWIRLYDKSPRRAIWSEWSFGKWDGEKLATHASWHDESPYDNIDSPFIVATNTKARASFRLEQTDSERDHESNYHITKDGKRFAEVVMLWRRSRIEPGQIDLGNVDLAYFFEKLTGLLRDLYPQSEDEKKPERLENFASVRVNGTQEAIKLLSFPPTSSRKGR